VLISLFKLRLPFRSPSDLNEADATCEEAVPCQSGPMTFVCFEPGLGVRGNTDRQSLFDCKEDFEAISDGLGRFWAYHLHRSLMRGLILTLFLRFVKIC
jgi:hypothetical protein